MTEKTHYDILDRLRHEGEKPHRRVAAALREMAPEALLPRLQSNELPAFLEACFGAPDPTGAPHRKATADRTRLFLAVTDQFPEAWPRFTAFGALTMSVLLEDLRHLPGGASVSDRLLLAWETQSTRPRMFQPVSQAKVAKAVPQLAADEARHRTARRLIMSAQGERDLVIAAERLVFGAVPIGAAHVEIYAGEALASAVRKMQARYCTRAQALEILGLPGHVFDGLAEFGKLPSRSGPTSPLWAMTELLDALEDPAIRGQSRFAALELTPSGPAADLLLAAVQQGFVPDLAETTALEDAAQTLGRMPFAAALKGRRFRALRPVAPLVLGEVTRFDAMVSGLAPDPGLFADKAAWLAGLTMQLDTSAAQVASRITDALGGFDDDTPESFLERDDIEALRKTLRSQLDKLPWRRPKPLRRALDQVLPVLTARIADVAKTARLRALRFSDVPAQYPLARAQRREIIYIAGPTNSGKTHAAFELLLAAEGGAYCGPLRLNALEAQERLEEAGHRCSLITGEERIDRPGARYTARTVETLPLDTQLPAVIVDEAQMLADPDRGAAWTAAICGAPAARIICTGPAYAAPLVARLAAACGDSFGIVKRERLVPLEAMDAPVTLKDLAPGDAVVVFSRRAVLEWRDRIASTGRRAAVIYGALGPDVRRAEAARFRSGEADVLVATDAIGLGLNLPIRRVLFGALAKFDGREDRWLDDEEIRQIAGRAGRYQADSEDQAPGQAGVVSRQHAKPPPLGRVHWALQGKASDLTGPALYFPPDRALLEADPSNPARAITRCAFAAQKSDLFQPAEAETVHDMAERLVALGYDTAESLPWLFAPFRLKSHGEEVAAWLLAARLEREMPFQAGDARGDLAALESEMTRADNYLVAARRAAHLFHDADDAKAHREMCAQQVINRLARQKAATPKANKPRRRGPQKARGPARSRPA